MDSRKRRHYIKGYRPTTVQYNSPFCRNNSDGKTKFGHYTSPKAQKQNGRINGSTSNNIIIHSKSPLFYMKTTSHKKPSPEEVEEEERRKRLSDTANKLLNKIKTWSAEHNSDVDVMVDDNSEQVSNSESKMPSSKKDSEAQGPDREEQCSSKKTHNTNTCRRRIAHSVNKNETVKIKNKITKCKKNGRPVGPLKKYDVNKASVKDFQQRIQHKLINEIMQMPKENLQNMLNNPKINPIMEVKISHLVRENRLLIAQKLRAMAEIKMDAKESLLNSQILDDIDKLIDPVIETDLSVLPYDLIKQMENIFQVEFDFSVTKTAFEMNPNLNNEISYCPSKNSTDPDNNKLCDTIFPTENNQSIAEDNSGRTVLKSETSLMNDLPSTSCENITNLIGNEDLTAYNCSTDEDVEKSESEQEDGSKFCYQRTPELLDVSKRRKITADNNYESCDENTTATYESDDCIEVFNSTNEKCSNCKTNAANSDVIIVNLNTEKDPTSTKQHSISLTEGISLRNRPIVVRSHTENESAVSAATQTDNWSPNFIYGVPVPEETKEETSTALLQEVTSIQNLINKLNERRFMIFLKLASIYPRGEFIADSFTEVNFVESTTNGNLFLADMMKEFFKKTRKNVNDSHRSRQYRSRGCRKRKRNEKSMKNQENHQQRGHRIELINILPPSSPV